MKVSFFTHYGLISSQGFSARRRRIGLALLLASGLLLGVPLSSEGADREYLLRWLPSTGTSAIGYRVHLAVEGGPFVTTLDLGGIPAAPDGIASTSLWLDAATSYLAAMTAYNAVGESDLSNVIEIPALGCDPALCADADPCTIDSCGGFGCFYTAAPEGSLCGAFEVCRSGSCQRAQCLASSDCDDGNRCNGSETCSSTGGCLAGSPLECGASSACAASYCDRQLGCQIVPDPDGTPCDDGRRDTLRDRCRAGICQGVPRRGRRG